MTVATVALSIGAALSAVPSAASTVAAPTGFAGPARQVTQSGLVRNGSAQFTSRNWAGYITYASSHGTDFNAVKATWVQPTVTCEKAGAWTVFWIGLDGWWDGTVEQGGSSARCGHAGSTPKYQLWWEMFPTVPVQTVLPTRAGDTITASVTYATATSVFTITVTDVTTGKSFTEHELCGSGLTCSRSSAEAITEDVGKFGAGSYFPLANYGTMGYTKISVTDTAGHAGAISGKHWLNAAVTEAGGGTTYATVSKLSAKGTAFTTTWRHQ